MKKQQFDIQTTPTNQQVVIVSRNHLLGYHLSLKFALSGLPTLLYHQAPSAITLKTHDPRITQQDYTPGSALPTAEYYLLIYPTLADLPLVNRIVQQAQPSGAKICIIINYRDQRLLQTLSNHLPQNVNNRFVILTDPYGPYFTTDADPVSQLLQSATQKQPLVVTDSGKLSLYPTHIDDLSPIVLKTLFTSGTTHQTFWLSTLESITNLDLAYQLINLTAEVLSVNLELSVTEGHSTVMEVDIDAIANSQNQLNWDPQVDIEVGLRQTLLSAAPPPADQKPPTKPVKPKVDLAKLPPIERKVRRFFNPKAWLIATFLLGTASLIALPLILFVINSYLGVTRLSKAMNNLQQGSTADSHSYALQATADFGRSRVLLQSSNPVLWVIPHETITKTDKLLDAFSRLSVVITTASETVGQAEGLYQIILGVSSAEFKPAVTSLKSSLDTLYSELSLVKVSLEKVDLGNNLEFFNTLNTAKKQLPDMLSQLQLGLSVLDLLPQMIGSPSPQTYLVLLQNSSELRPTGGFLGSYALITFQNGRLVDIKVDGVYQADSQLAGHVEPPTAIKKYLGESNWYMRDSNWYPNFPNTARQIQWFLQKEINRDVQGVVALNLYSVKDLLQAIGPISIADYQETVTADNLFERVEYRSEANFLPGADSRRDFLTSLHLQLLTQIKSGKAPLAKLASALDRSLRSRQILVMSNYDQTQKNLESLGFSGSVQNEPCPSAFATGNCTNATFALIEANLGVNKANYFIERAIQQTVTIEQDGRLNYLIAVNYKNKSATTAWPGGRYKTYTRLYVPMGTEVASIQFDQQEVIPESVNPLPDLGLTEIALYYEVPVNSNQVLKLNLRGSQIIPTHTNLSSLSVTWLKQSGTGDDPISININYPVGITPTIISLPADNPSQQLNFSTFLKANLTFAVQFAKNN